MRIGPGGVKLCSGDVSGVGAVGSAGAAAAAGELVVGAVGSAGAAELLGACGDFNSAYLPIGGKGAAFAFVSGAVAGARDIALSVA